MAANFDTSVPGTPYVRAKTITIVFPPPGSGVSPSVSIDQQLAVPLADGVTSVPYQEIGAFTVPIDLSNPSAITFPLININNNQPLPGNPTSDLGTLFELLVSYIRVLQIDHTVV